MHLLISLLASAVIAGTPLPPWQEGCLDIHAINSGRGECTFFILPDGTTMLVDAGEFVPATQKYPFVPQKPHEGVRPYEVYVRYIRHFMPAASRGALDYAVITHYHIDHTGKQEKDMVPDPERGYVLTGISGVESEIPIRRLVDRAWPRFEESLLESSSKNIDFYPAFVRYACRHDGMKAEAMEVGSRKQLRLRHHPCRYRNFSIFNYAASGIIWDGSKKTDAYEGKKMRENGASCCFLLSYGDFDYYTGGDAGGNSPVEVPVARAIGRPIEALKANHHLSYYTMKDETMRILQPEVIVTQGFTVRDIQPDYTIVDRILSDELYPGRKYMYFTNMGQQQLEAHKDVYSRAAGIGGHVVIRVMPGGKEYFVYLLDDTDFEYHIISVDGPFKCK